MRNLSGIKLVFVITDPEVEFYMIANALTETYKKHKDVFTSFSIMHEEEKTPKNLISQHIREQILLKKLDNNHIEKIKKKI